MFSTKNEIKHQIFNVSIDVSREEQLIYRLDTFKTQSKQLNNMLSKNKGFKTSTTNNLHTRSFSQNLLNKSKFVSKPMLKVLEEVEQKSSVAALNNSKHNKIFSQSKIDFFKFSKVKQSNLSIINKEKKKLLADYNMIGDLTKSDGTRILSNDKSIAKFRIVKPNTDKLKGKTPQVVINNINFFSVTRDKKEIILEKYKNYSNSLKLPTLKHVFLPKRNALSRSMQRNFNNDSKNKPV